MLTAGAWNHMAGAKIFLKIIFRGGNKRIENGRWQLSAHHMVSV